MWLNPPPIIVSLRNQLMLCPSLNQEGFTIPEDGYHYPSAIPVAKPKNPTPDPMPFIVLVSPRDLRDRYAEGAIPLISGDLLVHLYVEQNEYYGDVGSMETLARQIIIDLGSQYVGICFRQNIASVASELTPGQKGADEDTEQAGYLSITIPLSYGLKVR